MGGGCRAEGAVFGAGEGLAAAGREVVGCTHSWHPVLLKALWLWLYQWECTHIFSLP